MQRYAFVRYRRPSSLLPSVGQLGFGPSRKSPPHFWRRLWEGTIAMARGRSSYQNVGSCMTRFRQSQADSRQRAPPVDVAVAPAAATGGIPAPSAVVPATALEMAKFQGQMQQLTGICLGLQAQLSGQPAPTASISQERQAKSSHWRSRAPPAPCLSRGAQGLVNLLNSQVVFGVGRCAYLLGFFELLNSKRLESSCSSLYCTCASVHLPKSPIRSPTPRSVVGANSHKSGRADSAHSEQELARRLRCVVDLERRVDAMVQHVEGKAPAEEDLNFCSPFIAEILKARVSPKLPLSTIAPYDSTSNPADHIHGFESHMVFHGASDVAKCRAFPATLKETARAWFEALPAGSISSFHHDQGRSQLLAIRKKKGEALWDYIKRFQTKALRIPCLDVLLATSALIQGTRDGFLQRTLGVQ
ncbi:hypothetical protein Taro_042107 [Colocasia esculenta]|uniref:Retrotransposon gag domain-containing protein n=1 Tax=Colocasia esculenta TaxID=4460 RepID=A0A843WG10_COLES|nr:hypothetical protein [Colocasia esculenta]